MMLQEGHQEEQLVEQMLLVAVCRQLRNYVVSWQCDFDVVQYDDHGDVDMN